jgi:hypothetical protein
MAWLYNQNLKIKLRQKKMVEIQQIKVWLNQQLTSLSFDVLEGTFGSVMSAEGNVSVVDSTIL